MLERRNRRVVSLESIGDNYNWAVQRHPAGVKPVLKDDAYGHGLVAVAATLQDLGASHVFVACLAEAQALSEAGLKLRVTVLRAPRDLAECNEFRCLDVTPTLRSANDVTLAARYGSLAGVDIEVDAGLGRGGLSIDELPTALDGLATTTDTIGIGFQAPATLHIDAAAALVQRITMVAPSATVHVGGSSLVGALPMSAVRVGRLLFGIVPSRMRAQDLQLRAVSAWCTTARRIVSGTTVGYHTGVAPDGHDYYELDLGYVDGLPSRAIGWEVAAGDRLLRLVAVFMDRSVVLERSAFDEPELDSAEVLVVGEHPDHRARPMHAFADHLGCSASEAVVLPRTGVTYTDHEVCVCDVDGVLRHWDPAAAARVDHDVGLPSGSFNQLAFQLPEYHAAMVGKASFDDWCAAIQRELAARADTARVAAAMATWRQHRGIVDTDVLALLRKVRRHTRVVLLSNAHDCLRADLAILGIESEVDAVFGSADLAVAKPDPSVFAHVTDILGVAPHRCFFVDDLPDNVAAARRFGWDAIRFRSPQQLRDELLVRRLCR